MSYPSFTVALNIFLTYFALARNLFIDFGEVFSNVADKQLAENAPYHYSAP